MELNKWECILIEWVNCLNFCKPIKNIQECSLNFFHQFLQKVFPNDIKLDDITWITVTDIVRDKYPEFHYEHSFDKNDTEEVPKIEITLTNTLLLHYICVVKHQPNLTKIMCNLLSHDTQVLLREFLEKLPTPITRIILKEHLLSLSSEFRVSATPRFYQACGGDSPVTRNSPLQDFLHTPAMRSSFKRDNKALIHLRCQLSEERYEKEELQEELNKQQEKIEMLDKQLTKKADEISTLRQKIFILENATPPKSDKSENKTELHKFYQNHIKHFETECDRLSTKVDELQKEKENLIMKQKKSEEKYSSWRNAAESADTMCMTLTDVNKQQSQEIESLRETCSELSMLLEELRKERRKEETEKSFSSEGENLGNCVIDVQLQDSLKANTELKTRIEDLNNRLKQSEENFINVKNTRDIFEAKIQELEKLQAEMQKDFMFQLKEKGSENSKLISEQKEFSSRCLFLEETQKVLNYQLNQKERDYLELESKASELEKSLEIKLSELSEKDISMSALQKSFNDLHNAIVMNFNKLKNAYDLKKYENFSGDISEIKCITNDILVELETKAKVNKDLNIENEDLQKSFNVLNVDFNKINTQLELCQSENKTLKSDIESLNAIRLELEVKIDHLSEQIQVLNKAILVKNNTIDELKQLENVIAEKDELIHELKYELKDYNATKEELNSNKKDLSKTVLELENVIAEREFIFTKYENETKELNKTIQELHRINNEITAHELVLLEEAESTKIKLTDEIEALNISLEDSFKEKTSLLNTVQTLNHSIKQAMVECTDIEEKYKSSMDECNNLHNKIDTLQICKSVLEEKLAQTEMDIKLQIENWESKYTELSAKFDHSHAMLKNATKENEILEHEIEKLQNEIAKIQKEKHDLHTQLTVYENNILQKQFEIQDLESKLSESKSHLKSLSEKNENSEREILSLQKEIDGKVEQININEEKLSLVEADLEQLYSKYNIIENKYLEKLKELEEMSEQNSNNETKLYNLEKVIQEQEDQINDLTTQIKGKSNELYEGLVKFEEIKKENLEHLNVMENLQKYVVEIEANLGTKNKSIKELLLEKSRIKAGYEEKETTLVETSKELDAIKNTLEERQSFYENKIKEQEETLKIMEKGIEELKKEIEELDQVKEELTQALDNETVNAVTISTQLEKVNLTLAEAESKLEEKCTEIIEKQTILTEKEISWNETVCKLESKVNDLCNQLENSDSKVKELEIENANLNKKIEETLEIHSTKTETLQKQLKDSSELFHNIISERDALQVSLEQRNEENSQIEGLLESIRTRLSEEQILNETLRSELECKLEEKDLCLKKLSNTNEELEKQILNLTLLNKEMQANLQIVSDDCSKSKKRIEELELQKSAFEAQFKQQSEDMDGKIQTISKLNIDLQNSLEKINKLKGDKTKNETNYENTVCKLKNVELKYEEAEMILKAREEALAKSECEKFETNGELQKSILQIDILNRNIIELNERELELNDLLEETRSQLNKATDKLADTISEEEKNKHELGDKLKSFSSKLIEFEKEKNSLQQEYSECEEQLQKTIEELEICRNEKRDLENIIKVKEDEQNREKEIMTEEINEIKNQLLLLQEKLQTEQSQKENALDEVSNVRENGEKRLRELKTILDESEENLKLMKIENERLNDKIMYLSNLRIELNDELQKIATEKQSLEQQLCFLQKQLCEIEKKKSLLETGSSEKSQVINSLRDEVEVLSKTLKDLELEQIKLKSELEETVIELKKVRKNRDEILEKQNTIIKQTEDNILRAMEQAQSIKTVNEQTEKEIVQEKSLRALVEQELREQKQTCSELMSELEAIKCERDNAFKTLVESRRCIVNMMKAFEVIPGNQNLVFDEQSLSEYEFVMIDIVKKYTEQCEKVAKLEENANKFDDELKIAMNEKLELQKKHDKIWSEYTDLKKKHQEGDKVKTDKENILRSANIMNKTRSHDALNKLTEDERKKLTTLKQKLIIVESAKSNLEKKLKEVREENKALKEQNSGSGDEAYKVLLKENTSLKEEVQKYKTISETPAAKDSRPDHVLKELAQLKESYGTLRADKSVLELQCATLNKILDDRNNQLSEHSLIKEAYEKLVEDNSKAMMELDTIKFKRNRDRDEYVRLLKKEKEMYEAQLNKKVQDVRAEYEIKLENMKTRMVELYKEEVDKEMHKRFGDNNENAFLHKLIEQLRKERDLVQRKYDIAIMEDKHLVKEDVYGSRESISSRRSTMSARESGISKRPGIAVRDANSRRVSTLPRSAMGPPAPPQDFIEETVTISRRRSISTATGAFGKGMDMEDEEGDFFNNKYLDDMKAGRCMVPNVHRESSRLSELQRRNSMYPPHLKSSYPAETQFTSPSTFKEDDIKTGIVEFDDSMSRALLPGEKPRKKDIGTTSYKKPGPPTPSKNGGRLSSQGSDFHFPGRDNTATETTKTPKKISTPNRIKQLFMGRNSIRDISENTQNSSTPKNKQRLSIFRKPR